jgi:hypothetical protein
MLLGFPKGPGTRGPGTQGPYIGIILYAYMVPGVQDPNGIPNISICEGQGAGGEEGVKDMKYVGGVQSCRRRLLLDK